MSIKVGVGGTYKAVESIKVGVSGAWKAVEKAWVGVGGVWKEVYTAASVLMPPSISDTNVVSGAPATAGIIVNTDGTISKVSGAASTTWFVPTTTGIGSSYQVLITNTSGTLDTGTAGTWQTISSNLQFSITRSTVGLKSYTGTISIRDLATATVLDTATLSFDAERT